MAKGIKTGGRIKGTPNTITKELKTVLKDLMDKEMNLLPNHLESLEVKDRLELFVKLLPYVLPKVDSTQVIDLLNSDKSLSPTIYNFHIIPTLPKKANS